MLPGPPKRRGFNRTLQVIKARIKALSRSTQSFSGNASSATTVKPVRNGVFDAKIELEQYNPVIENIPDGFYTQFQNERGIRLLFLGRHQDGHVYGHLKTANLDEKPIFAALSYTWGDPKSPIPFTCDGQVLHISQNLYAALSQIQHSHQGPTTPVPIWADQICINQTDIQERNQQVRLMGDIYREAVQTLVWLGVEADDSDLAMKFLKIIGTTPNAHFDAKKSPQLDRKYLSADYARALDCLMDRSWWKRVWTVQEAVLPRNLLFLCGSREVAGEHLFTAARSYYRHQDSCCFSWFRFAAAGSFLSLVWFVGIVGQLFGLRTVADERSNLVQLMVDFRQRECSDPRDKVYGYLGLGTGIFSDFLLPSYESTVEQVLETTALELIRKSGNLELFSCLDDSWQQDSGLPSWVPTWAACEDKDGTWVVFQRLLRVCDYSASGGESLFFTSVQPGAVMSKGVKVDTISTTDQPPKYISRAFASAEDHWVYRLPDLKVYGTKLYMGGQISAYDAYLLTVCNGMGSDSRSQADVVKENRIEDRIHQITHSHRAAFEARLAYLEGEDPSMDTIELNTIIHSCTYDRSFITSENGYIGTGPAQAQPGDIITVLYGGNMCYILRPTGDEMEIDGTKNPTYYILGDAYVQGLMDGEAIEAKDDGELKEETFLLV